MCTDTELSIARLESLLRAISVGSHTIKSSIKSRGDGRYIIEFDALPLVCKDLRDSWANEFKMPHSLQELDD